MGTVPIVVYDNEGNRIRRTRVADGAVTEYAWDARERLTEVTERAAASGPATQVVDYIYDAVGSMKPGTKYDFTVFKKQFKRHFTKGVDYVVLGMRALTAEDRMSMLNEVIPSLSPADAARLITLAW